jgi:hypothetical protein
MQYTLVALLTCGYTPSLILNKTGKNSHNVPNSFDYFAISFVVCLKLSKHMKKFDKPGKMPR